MKILSSILSAFILMFATTTFASSCADDNKEEKKPEIPEDIPDNPSKPDDIPGIPQEYLDKIEAVYGTYTTGPQEIKTVADLSALTSISSTIDGCGPISATPATLNGEPITLVTLGGMQNVEGQATTMLESQLASMGKPNDYLTALTNLFTNGTIPADRPVIISGYSMGGMIAQQILGVKGITDKFDIKQIVTFGSPITLPFDRKNTRVVRFTDYSDNVPNMGEMMLRNGMVQIEGMTQQDILNKINELNETERICRKGQYTDWLITHALSYISEDCWNDFDCLGDKAGTNVITLKDSMRFYHAPQIKH